MNGIVTDRLELQVEFKLFAEGRFFDANGTVDTRFPAEIVIPQNNVSALNLKYKMLDTFDMLDGTICYIPVYEAEIEWNNKRLRVYVHSIGEENILIGVGLLFLLDLDAYIAPGSEFVLKEHENQ